MIFGMFAVIFGEPCDNSSYRAPWAVWRYPYGCDRSLVCQGMKMNGLCPYSCLDNGTLQTCINKIPSSVKCAIGCSYAANLSICVAVENGTLCEKLGNLCPQGCFYDASQQTCKDYGGNVCVLEGLVQFPQDIYVSKHFLEGGYHETLVCPELQLKCPPRCHYDPHTFLCQSLDSSAFCQPFSYIFCAGPRFFNLSVFPSCSDAFDSCLTCNSTIIGESSIVPYPSATCFCPSVYTNYSCKENSAPSAPSLMFDINVVELFFVLLGIKTIFD